MAITFITGAPGAGKTTIANELLNRGFNVYDTDDPERTGIAGWHDLATGSYIAGFNELEVTEELLQTTTWRLTDRALTDFRNRAINERIYLSGRLRDATPIIAVSKFLVFLVTQPEAIEQRLTLRSQLPNQVEWGRETWQIKRSIDVNREIEDEYRMLGAIMISTNREPKLIVDDIISQTSH